jgi:HEAT repeat protein
VKRFAWLGLALLPVLASFAVPVPAVDEVDELKGKLQSRDKRTRKSAVEKLARLDRPEAWELVIDALADEKGEVSDTAQFLLDGVTDAELVKELLGKRGLKSKDRWIRLRAAEVVGRLAVEVDGAPLAKALSDKDPAVRRALLWSIQRLAEQRRLAGGSLQKVSAAVSKAQHKDKDDGVRGRALAAWYALNPESSRKEVRAAVGSKAPELRCVAASLLPAVEGPGAVGKLVRFAVDPSPSVRTQAVDSLVEVGTREAAQALAAWLADEQQARIAWRIVEHLQRLSGLKHRDDPRPWTDWAERLPEDWKPAGAERAEGNGDRSVAFAGLPILTTRVTFLIDLSGSIWTERADGTTRKQKVDEQLRRVLEALPETTEFNVIPYTEHPIPWQDELVRATPSNVRKAVAWFEGRKDSGTGNFWDAAMLALEDPRCDSLVVLTDGAPTGGRRYHLGLMVPLFEELAATRRVAVDSILVDASRNLQRYWADLAKRTGGHSIAISL